MKTYAPIAAGIEDTFPLAYGQRAIWFVQRLAPGNAAYNVLMAYRLGDLDVAAFGRAWQLLSDHQPSLRTTYGQREGEPYQRVHVHLPVDFQVLPADGADDAELERRLTREAHLPFDLERGPIVRLRLFRRAPGDHVLLLAMHHIAVDAASLPVLMRELGQLYRALARREPAVLPPLPCTYGDFVRGQLELLSGPGGARLESYWRRRLAGAPPLLPLPTDRPRGRVQTFRGATRTVTFEPRLTRTLKALAASASAPLAALLLAAFQALLYRYSGQPDVLVGTPVSGRSRPEHQALVGFFINTLVLRGELAGNPTFRALLAQAAARWAEAREHQDYPFTLLVEKLQPDRSAGQSPLFQVFFVLYQDAPGAAAEEVAPEDSGLTLEAFPLQGQAAMLDLSLMMNEAHDHLAGTFQYNTDLFDAPTLEQLAADFAALLQAVADNPDRHVDGLPASLGAALQQPSEERVAELTHLRAGALDGVRDRAEDRLHRLGRRRRPGAERGRPPG